MRHVAITLGIKGVDKFDWDRYSLSWFFEIHATPAATSAATPAATTRAHVGGGCVLSRSCTMQRTWYVRAPSLEMP